LAVKAKILISEDSVTVAEFLRDFLIYTGYTVEVVPDGLQALQKLKQTAFDVLLLDLNMPVMDGLKLLEAIQTELTKAPLCIMITGYPEAEIRKRAKDLGCYLFLIKPINIESLDSFIQKYLPVHKKHPPRPLSLKKLSDQWRVPVKEKEKPKPPFVCLVIAASTGGPKALEAVLKKLEVTKDFTTLIVQHGPKWMLQLFADKLTERTNKKVELASDGQKPKPGHIYLAIGDHHLYIESGSFKIKLCSEAPKINSVRPAADPLFHSAADAFGPYCIGVVLTGLGKDGAEGGKKIYSEGGHIIAQDPKTAVASTMPLSIIDLKIQNQIASLEEIPEAINGTVSRLAKNLK
jgi:two-component system, chemotaxis family, protein-glutamate methylesterase/glutaminase